MVSNDSISNFIKQIIPNHYLRVLRMKRKIQNQTIGKMSLLITKTFECQTIKT